MSKTPRRSSKLIRIRSDGNACGTQIVAVCDDGSEVTLENVTSFRYEMSVHHGGRLELSLLNCAVEADSKPIRKVDGDVAVTIGRPDAPWSD